MDKILTPQPTTARSDDSVSVSKIGEISDTDTAAHETPTENPWPYLDKFFKFICKKSKDNIEFECLLCKPTSKRLSANVKSHINLRKHIARMHEYVLGQYQKCIDERSRPKKRQCNEPLESSKENTEKRQLTLKYFSQPTSSRVSQTLFEEKVSMLLNS